MLLTGKLGKRVGEQTKAAIQRLTTRWPNFTQCTFSLWLVYSLGSRDMTVDSMSSATRISLSLSLTCVYPAVLGQVTGNGEGLAAVLAHVGPLTRVGPHVLLQVAARRPSLAAYVAHVRPLARVPPDVHIEAGQRGEVLGAVGAAVGPLAGVCAHVSLKAVARLEALAALRTQEAAPVAVVAGAVRLEACQRAECLGALVAAVRAAGVCALVDPQLRHAWKTQSGHVVWISCFLFLIFLIVDQLTGILKGFKL